MPRKMQNDLICLKQEKLFLANFNKMQSCKFWVLHIMKHIIEKWVMKNICQLTRQSCAKNIAQANGRSIHCGVYAECLKQNWPSGAKHQQQIIQSVKTSWVRVCTDQRLNGDFKSREGPLWKSPDDSMDAFVQWPPHMVRSVTITCSVLIVSSDHQSILAKTFFPGLGV